MITILSYFAIAALAVSYWFQIWKIHVHREVRDISLCYHILLALGFGFLIIPAWVEGSNIFLVKQVVTFIPVLIIIAQIFWHRKDHWHDEYDLYCTGCKDELEDDWAFCPYCGDPKAKRFQPKK